MVSGQSYSIGEVAMMIGVRTHTIRAWEKRHGLVSGERTAGQMRRYSLDDVETLRQVKVGRMVRGLSVKLAVQWAMGLLPDNCDEPAGRGSLSSLPRPPLRVDGDGGPWRAIVDALPHLVFIVDASGRLADVNVSAAKVTGRRASGSEAGPSATSSIRTIVPRPLQPAGRRSLPAGGGR